MVNNFIIASVSRKFQLLSPSLDEKTRRYWAACEAMEIGHGGIKTLSKITGLSERTISRGCQELRQRENHSNNISKRVRHLGGGRKVLTESNGELISALEALVDPTTRGDPMSPLRWTCKSTRKLASALQKQGHKISHTKVAQLLSDLDYSLQGTRKILEGKSHPDRDKQFRFLNRRVKAFQKLGQPVISVDAKKKELVGNFSNAGQDYQLKGKPLQVNTHNFPDQELGKVCPYGIYDITKNKGWVNIGIDHDTAQFAVASIKNWWQKMGTTIYPNAKKLLMTADSGGSNAYRTRLWKFELQKLADEIGLTIYVCHFPPGTSKWNKIEHRMFCHISENWRGQPLVSHEIIVNLISQTTTRTGLKISAELDENSYPTGIKITNKQMKEIKLQPAKFHGQDWNYSIIPK